MYVISKVGLRKQNWKNHLDLIFSLENVSETDCNLMGLSYLMEKIPQSELIYPLVPELEKNVIIERKVILDMWLEMSRESAYDLVSMNIVDLVSMSIVDLVSMSILDLVSVSIVDVVSVSIVDVVSVSIVDLVSMSIVEYLSGNNILKITDYYVNMYT